MALVFQGKNKITHIVVAKGWVSAPNAELMVLEMSIATALVVGCSSLVCFTDSTVAMADIVDPSPYSGQNSSLAACTALWGWFLGAPTRSSTCGIFPPRRSGRSIMTPTRWQKLPRSPYALAVRFCLILSEPLRRWHIRKNGTGSSLTPQSGVGLSWN